VSVPASLSSTEDAIHLAEVALGRDDLVGIVERAKLVMPISGRITPGTIIQVDQILLLAWGDDDDRVILATRRRSGPCIALEDELADWRTMRAAHEGRALVLADWLVFVGDGTVLSMAELSGTPAAW
jgi:hypothetical protein